MLKNQRLRYYGLSIPLHTHTHEAVDDPPKSNKDFEDNPIHVEFLPDEYVPVNDLPVHVPIIDDNINEASEEYFIVKLDPTGSNKNVKVAKPRASLCKIVDNDRKCIFPIAWSKFTINYYLHHLIVLLIINIK